MISEIMATVTTVTTGLGTALAAAFTSISGIFWSGTALTLPGILALVAAGGGLLYFAFNFVRGLLGKSSR
jgi:hypothetical protein